ncbi:MAG: acyltransferase family protein [Pseudomonadota bacterium]
MNTKAIRLEIQGLRAIAVLLVLISHIWPEALPGGFIGVDVFFVISGFLITDMLAREADSTNGILLANFYARRVRRLLPAASVVLIFILVGTLLILPAPRWADVTHQVIAAAVYMQNWVLAANTVDYWATGAAPTPVQHYWSLSIEEQFYIIWPLAIILISNIASIFRIPMRRPLAIFLGVVFLLSLYASISMSSSAPEEYFYTHTRIWELALGGLLALAALKPLGSRQLQLSAYAMGLSAIFSAALMFNEELVFPGYIALIPTLATALLIWAGNLEISGYSVLGNSIFKYLGDRSYSIYLWHWPLIIFANYLWAEVSFVIGAGLIATTLLVSHFSYALLEKPFQRLSKQNPKRNWRAIGAGITSIAVCIGAAYAAQLSIEARTRSLADASDPDYPGPVSLIREIAVSNDVPPIPDLAVLANDKPKSVLNGCHQRQSASEARFCLFGDKSSDRTIALIGDSHAAQWAPALETIAEEQGWALIEMTKSACPFSRITARRGDEIYSSCNEWRKNALERLLKLAPDVVFVSQARYDYETPNAFASGALSLWQELTDADIKIVAIADTPWFPFQPGECLARSKDCGAPRTDVLPGRDPMIIAAARMADAHLVNMTDYICGSHRCEMIVGNVVVWRDNHHLTATYARLLSPFFYESVRDILSPSNPALERDSTPDTVTSPQQTQRFDGVLECDPLSETVAGFTIPISVYLRADSYLVRRGDWKERKGAFDHWVGRTQGDRIIFTGFTKLEKYQARDVTFVASLKDGTLSASGWRGTRACTFEVTASDLD